MCWGQLQAVISIDCQDRITNNQVLEYNKVIGIETMLIHCNTNQRIEDTKIAAATGDPK